MQLGVEAGDDHRRREGAVEEPALTEMNDSLICHLQVFIGAYQDYEDRDQTEEER